MNTHADKTQQNKSNAVANSTSKLQNSNEAVLQSEGNMPALVAQNRTQGLANNSPQVKQLEAYKELANNSQQVQQLGSYQAITNTNTTQLKKGIEEELSHGKTQSVQKKENNTGLPDQLKSGVENLSGHSMDDVKVHYNSDKPAQLNAHAYAQGTEIHIGSGQEKHLPHEAWHVVQQKQGRVEPTMQMKGKVNINDDAGLEKEADVMGAKAAQLKADPVTTINNSKLDGSVTQKKGKEVVQRALAVGGATQTVNQVVAHFNGTANALTDEQTEILQSWHASGTLHDFSNWNKIPEALRRAAAMAANPPPALFVAANLLFITQDPDRLATYYFNGGGQTGRLRQQHGSGPLASVDAASRTRASFGSRADRDAFIAALRTSRDNAAAFVAPAHVVVNNPPANGELLLEYRLNGGVAEPGWHPSGGLVQPVPPGQNTNQAISAIYNNIIGAGGQVDAGCCFITTACALSKGLPDDCEELQTLREYRDTYLLQREHGKELFKFYYTYSPAIVQGINAQPDAPKIYDGLYTVIRKCVASIRIRQLEEAFRIYVEMVLMLKDRYAPGTAIPSDLQMILQKSLQ